MNICIYVYIQHNYYTVFFFVFSPASYWTEFALFDSTANRVHFHKGSFIRVSWNLDAVSLYHILYHFPRRPAHFPYHLDLTVISILLSLSSPLILSLLIPTVLFYIFDIIFCSLIKWSLYICDAIESVFFNPSKHIEATAPCYFWQWSPVETSYYFSVPFPFRYLCLLFFLLSNFGA